MDQLFEKKLLILLSLPCLLLLCLPKLNFLTFEQETAGLRIDDIILLIFSLFLAWSFAVKNKRIFEIEIWLALIVFFSLISFLINLVLVNALQLHVNSKIFYVFRIVEYFLFFYVGCMAAHFLDIKKFVTIYFILNVIVMLLQKIGILGRLTELGNQSIDTERVSGLASFPAEMGGLLSLMFCFFLVNPSHHGSLFHIRLPGLITYLNKKTRSFILLLVFLFLITLTGARIALISTLVMFIAYQMVEKKFSLLRLLSLLCVSLAIIIPIMTYLITISDALLVRSSGLFSLNNFQIITNVWDKINIETDLYKNIQLDKGDYDMSWWMRIHKWCYVLKLYTLHPENYLLGIGPGAFSAAVDGSFLRILTENGIIGFFCYWMFFKHMASISRTMKWVLTAFFINMIFFDIYLAYKPMAFVFLLAGYYSNNQTPLLQKTLKEKTKSVSDGVA